MKKGDIVEGIVEYVDFPNKGKVVVETKIVTVKNCIPGEKVSCQIQKMKHGSPEGRLLEIIEPSAEEVESYCPHFRICGGCSYQTLPYEKQLALKESQIKKLLSRVLLTQNTDVEEIFEPIKGSPVQFGYRNKMEFSFGDEVKDGPLSLGMHKRGSFYDIVTVKSCQIVDADYRKILECAWQYFTQKETPFFHRVSHVGYLRHLLVRKAVKTGEILIDLVTTSQMPAPTICTEKSLLEDMADAFLKLKLEGKIVGILNTINDSLADVVKNDHTDILYGKEYFYEELLGLKFKISPFSFFQTNSLGAEVLYEAVREFVGELRNEGKADKTVFDLYSGTGTIAQMLAPVAKKVIGVEIVEEAVEAAKENAELNGLHNCIFIAGDVLKVLDDITEKPNMIVLDPPRDGIHPKALRKIIDYGVDRIVYISCKPTSLARDLETFIGRGYKVERIAGIDLFPGTVHVETIVALHRKDT